jgi:GNAT superfamily N-acetyltransferase
MGQFQLVEVKTKRHLRDFIYVPEKIHRGHATWMPPIYMDEWAFFNPKKNHAFSHCDTILLVAYQGKIPVGRIMGIIHHEYNKIHGEKHARFSFLETYDDKPVTFALLTAIEDWARKKGMEKLIGPFGFTDKDPQGLLIEGFEHMPLLVSACNFPYLVNFVEEYGFTKEVDCLVYKYQLNNHLPDVYGRVMQRFNGKPKYRLVEYASKKELRPHVKPILLLINETYKQLYGFFPMSEKEMEEFANRYMAILDPKYVKSIFVDDKPIAFVIGLLNFTKGIQKAKGHLFPLGFWYILRAMKKTKQLDLMLGAVDYQYQGLGLELLMGIKLLETCKKEGLDTLEVHLVLETNTKMLAELQRIDAKIHKRFRVFQKSIL